MFHTTHKTERTDFEIGVCLSQPSDDPLIHKHPPTMHGAKIEKKRSDVESGMVIWTPGQVRVQLFENVKVSSNADHVL
jgi:galactose-1-phosphate uridylyltransferase